MMVLVAPSITVKLSPSAYTWPSGDIAKLTENPPPHDRHACTVDNRADASRTHASGAVPVVHRPVAEADDQAGLRRGRIRQRDRDGRGGGAIGLSTE